MARGYQDNLIQFMRERADALEKAAKSLREAARVMEQEGNVNPDGSVWMPTTVGKRISQGDAVYEILRRSSVPMSRSEIRSAMHLFGHNLKSEKNVAPLLSRDQRIVSVGRGMWWLKNHVEQACEDDRKREAQKR